MGDMKSRGAGDKDSMTLETRGEWSQEEKTNKQKNAVLAT